MGDDPNRRGIGRKWIMQAIDESLARLGTDYVDLYYLHKDVEETPLEGKRARDGRPHRRGKVRYFGVSNFRGWRIAEIANVCRLAGIPGPAASQPYYNAMNRQPENDILPACAHHGIGVVPYSPLARGVLTGKYGQGDAPPADSRVGRKDKRIMETEFRAESLAIAQKVKAHAQAKGLTGGSSRSTGCSPTRSCAASSAGRARSSSGTNTSARSARRSARTTRRWWIRW